MLLSRATSEAKPTGTLMLVYGPAGVGKTSTLSQAPGVLVAQVRDKSIDKLVENGIISPVPKLNVDNWAEANGLVDELTTQDHEYRTLLWDGVSGLEEFCDAQTIKDHYEGDRDKFLAYGKGDVVSADEWAGFLNRLDRLKEERRMTIILLAHQQIQTIQNPNGTNYIQYVPWMHKLKFGPTNKYFDAVLMMDHVIAVAKQDSKDTKGKAAVGGRILFCDGNAGYYAKNRLNLPPMVNMGTSHNEGWSNFVAALKEGKVKKAA